MSDCCDTSVPPVGGIPAPLTCEQLLYQARQAYQDILFGGRAVEVQYRDQRVKYESGNITALAKYIKELEAVCGGGTGTGVRPKRPRAAGLTFGDCGRRGC